MISPARVSRDQGAVEALSAIVEQVDPLYRPAEFLLGYSYLSRGDAKNAAAVFKRLTDRFEEQAKQLVEKLGQEWAAGIRWMRVGKHIRFVREWTAFYVDALTYLHGGTFIRAAEIWQDLKSVLDETSTPEWTRDFREARIDALIHNLDQTLKDGQHLGAIAAGRITSEQYSQAQARRSLDFLLDPHEIWKFDFELSSLNSAIVIEIAERAFAAFGQTGDPPLQASKPSAVAEKLGKHRIAEFLLQPGVQRLQSLVKDEKWKEAQEAIRELQRFSRARSPQSFAGVLDNAETESWKGRVAGMFLPALLKVRQHRRELLQPLYVESTYYLAQSMLMSFEAEGLEKALEQAQALRTERLSPHPSTREQDLHLLTVCLEIEAGVRLAEIKPDAPYLFHLDREPRKKLKTAIDDPKRSREVRSAAYMAMGITERDERRKQAQRDLEKNYFVDEEKQALSRNREMDYYRQALEVRPSANTHCYLAECLIASNRRDEARAHVRQALLTAPLHVLGLQLAKDLGV